MNVGNQFRVTNRTGAVSIVQAQKGQLFAETRLQVSTSNRERFEVSCASSKGLDRLPCLEHNLA